MEARLRAGAAEICKELGLEMEIEQSGKFDPVKFDDDCVGAVRRAAQRLGYSHRDIVSGAGHDACWINRIAPTAMVMCPCVDGLSHNEAEEIQKTGRPLVPMCCSMPSLKPPESLTIEAGRTDHEHSYQRRYDCYR